MDNLSFLKAQVRQSRKLSSSSLTYSQHLEVACRLLFGSASLNHFTIAPDNYTASLPETIEEVLKRIQNVCPMIHIAPEHEIPGYEIIEQWGMAADIWVGLLNGEKEESSLMWLLRQTDEFGDLNLPLMATTDGQYISIVDSSMLDVEEKLRIIFSAWLPFKEGPERAYLIEHWDRLRDVAASKGLDDSQSAFYRAICRESYNHSWSLEAMVLLGVLDIEPERGTFFTRFKSPEESTSTMKNIWMLEEPDGIQE